MAKEEECTKLTKVNEQYNIHYNKKKDIITKLQEELKSKEMAIATAAALEEKYANQMAPMRDELNLEKFKNKSLGRLWRTCTYMVKGGLWLSSLIRWMRYIQYAK